MKYPKPIADATPTKPVTFPKPKRTTMFKPIAAGLRQLASLFFSWETASFFLFVLAIGASAHYFGDRYALLAGGGLIYMKAARGINFAVTAVMHTDAPRGDR